MTKAKLIELLKDCPDDIDIVIPGHSDSNDYDDLLGVNKITLEVYPEYTWSGRYFHSPIGKEFIRLS